MGKIPVTLRALGALAIALLAAEGCGASGNAASSPTAGDTVFTEDFETGSLASWTDGVDPGRQQVVTDSSQAQSGSRFLRVTYPTGGDGGWLTHFLRSGYDSLYVSYYVRFPPDWRGPTKLVALYGSRSDDQWSAFGKAGACPTGDDFFAAMLIAEATGDPGPLRFYSYYPAMAREPDGVTCWGRYGDGTERYVEPLTMSRGVWHHVEFWVKLNKPGHANGTQTFWVDGTPRGTWPALSFRSSSRLRLNAVQLTFNRGASSATTTQTLDVDHLVVTTKPNMLPPEM